MVTNFSVTNENNTESAIFLGAPHDVAFEKFNVGTLKHAPLPGSKSVATKGLAIFQEAVVKGVSIVHIQIRSERPRTVKIKATEPAIILTFVMHGSPIIQWANLMAVKFKQGQFNLYTVPRHLQTIQVESGITDLLNIQLTTRHLQTQLDFNEKVQSFLNLANKGKSVQYLDQPIYGSPKQQHAVYRVMGRLCKEKLHAVNRDELLEHLLTSSMHELEEPDLLEFTYEETEELAEAMNVFGQYFSVPSIYKKELARTTIHKLRFDQAFLQACDCTAQQYIRNAQMKMAKRMLEESLPLHMVVRSIGYKNRIQQFNKDFLAYFGVALAQFIRSYEGKPW